MKLSDNDALAMYRRTEFPNETELSWPVAAAARVRRSTRHGEPPAALRREPRPALANSEAPGD